MHDKSALIICLTGLLLTGCGKHVVTVYAPEQEASTTVQEETIVTEDDNAEEIVESDDPNVLFQDREVTIRFTESSMSQGSFYIGLEVNNTSHEDVTASVSGVAFKGRMLPEEIIKTEPMYIPAGEAGSLSIDLDAEKMEAMYPGFAETENPDELPFSFSVEGVSQSNAWKTVSLTAGKEEKFPIEEQVNEVYTDNNISVYNNGEKKPGEFAFVIRNKTDRSLDISLSTKEGDENTLDYYILDADMDDEATIIGNAYEEVSVTLPVENETPPILLLHVQGADPKNAEISIETELVVQ